jgi:hypothetical protein
MKLQDVDLFNDDTFYSYIETQRDIKRLFDRHLGYPPKKKLEELEDIWILKDKRAVQAMKLQGITERVIEFPDSKETFTFNLGENDELEVPYFKEDR